MNSTASSLLIWASSDPDSQSAAQALISAAPGETSLCDSLSAMRQAAEAEPDRPLCLLYTTLVRHLVHCLKQEPDLDAVSAQWRLQTSDLLDFYRKNRARCHLFESGHLQRFSKIALARLGLPDGASLPFDPTETIDQDADLWALVAGTYLSDRPDISDLAEELAASSTVLSNDTVLDEPILSREALSALRTQGRRMAEQTAKLDKLDHVRRTLEVQLAEAKGAQTMLEQQSHLLLSELRLATTQLAQKTQETDKLTRDLSEQAHIQQEQGQKITDIETDRDARIHALNAEINRIMQSRSMRLTAPLRTLLRRLGRKPHV